MTINLTDPANHPANGPLTVERITRLIAELRRSLQYQNGGDMAYVIADAIKGLEELLEIRKSEGGWIPVSERMPTQGDYVSAVSRHGEYVSGLVNDEWLELHDGTSFGVDEIYLWMPTPPLPEAPQEVK